MPYNLRVIRSPSPNIRGAMKQNDRKKISRLRKFYKNEKKTTLAYPLWVRTFFWDSSTKEQITTFLTKQIELHGSVLSVTSSHPLVREHTPLHLPYLYRHDLSFEDGSVCALFQKFNFTRDLTSLFASVIWAYLAQLSPNFRMAHRLYERNEGRAVVILHPHPRSLWGHYMLFLSTFGSSWNAKENTHLGPAWVVCTDVTAVTLAVADKNQTVGSSVYSHVVDSIHQSSFQKKSFELLGESVARTLQSCYTQKAVFIDVGLGNYILDSKARARAIDGELFQLFAEAVPSHYKALELVLFMEDIYIETVRDYCRTINSSDVDKIRRYQQGLFVFFSSFLTTLDLTKDELALAQAMYHDWSTKLGTFIFTIFLALHWDARVMSSFRVVLKESIKRTLVTYTSG